MLNAAGADAYFTRGMAHMTQKDFDLALSDFDAGLKITSDNTVLAFRSFVYLMKRDAERAFIESDALIRQGANSFMAYFVRANTHLLKDEIAPAPEDFAQGLRLNPNHVQAYNARGMLYFQAGALKESLEDLSSIVRISPNASPAIMMRGIIKSRMGDAAGAKIDIDAAEALTPGLTAEFAMRGLTP